VDKEILAELVMEPLGLPKIALVAAGAQALLVRRLVVLLVILVEMAVMEPHRPSQAHQ
jgi:hypothetical protein